MLRKFRRISLAAAGALAVSGAGATGNPNASGWEVMIWSDPLTVSVDTASIAGREGRVIARVLWDYAEPQLNGDAAAAPYRSMIGTVVFDCGAHSMGAAGSVAFSGDGGAGQPVARYAIDPDTAPLSAAPPGTIGNDLVTLVCGQFKLRATTRQARSLPAPVLRTSAD